MDRARCAAVLFLLTFVSTGPARAEDLAGRFSLALQGGTQLELAGDATSSVQGTLFGRPAQLEATPYDDVYRPRLRLQALVAYGVTPNLEVLARGSRSTSKLASVEAGVSAGGPLLLCFESAEGEGAESCGGPELAEYGLELGVRFTIAPHSRLKSYFAVVAGIRRTDQVLVSLRAPASASAVLHVPFASAETVPVFGADLGFTVDLTEHTFLGLEGGVRYERGHTPEDLLPELGRFRTGSRRLTAPFVMTLGVRL